MKISLYKLAPATRMLTRRQTLKGLAAAGCSALAIGLYTWRVEPHWLEISWPDLSIAGLPQKLEGNTLAQISDLHVGPKVDDAYILESFRRVREIHPDFVAFTGDWITYRGPQQFEQLRRVLRQVPHGRLGTVGILGNHDYGINWRMLEVAEQVTKIASAAGVRMLRNEACDVAGLQFIGLDDLWGPRFDPAEVLAEKGQDDSTIVLSHNPDAADRRVWGRYQGWILSGHTHGGQCKPPFLPPPLLPVSNKGGMLLGKSSEQPRANERVLQEDLKSLLGYRFALHALQLLPDSPNLACYASNGSGRHKSRLDNRRNSECFGATER